MNYRVTVVLLAILVVLGGVVLLTERGSEPPATPTPIAGDRIFNFETQNVSGLAVNWSGKTVDLRRDANGQWQIAQPEQAAAVPEVEQFATQLGQLRSRRDIVARSSELSAYGLDQPQATITVTLKSGENQRLLVGKASPDGSTYYTRKPVGDQEVVVRVAPAAAVEDLRMIAEEPPKMPTPTVTPGGPAVPTPTATATPTPAATPTSPAVTAVPTPLLRPVVPAAPSPTPSVGR